MHVETEFIPGAIGTIIALHGEHYARNWGFGAFFESKVASELAEFASRKAEDDLVLLAVDDTGIAASLIMDLNDTVSGDRGAHLRWFIAADRCRGTGIGRKLMERAMDHANARSSGKVWLTTFAGLDSARHLYEQFGFTLTHQAKGDAWGTPVEEQEFRRLP